MSGTYHVQHCDVHTDHTSYIHVECTLAINSTAPGFVLIQDEQGQYTINTTLQRHEGDVSKGSVNFTDLPAGEYRVTVYDEMKDYFNNYSPACTYYDLPQIVPLINFGPIITSTLSSMYSRVYGKGECILSKVYNCMPYNYDRHQHTANNNSY